MMPGFLACGGYLKHVDSMTMWCVYIHAASSLVRTFTCIVNAYRNLYKYGLYIYRGCIIHALAQHMEFFDILAVLYFKLSMATHSHLLDNSCIYEILVCIKSCIYIHSYVL